MNYTLAACDEDSDCGIDGVCAIDGTCICPFSKGSALCDIPTNVSGTCMAFSGVRLPGSDVCFSCKGLIPCFAPGAPVAGGGG
jgi:hypothetical protein